MIKLHYNFKDVFRAARLGFSAKKMWIQFLGLLIGVLGYLILSYIAFLVGTEYSFMDIWNQFKFVPLPFGVQFAWFGWIILALSLIWFVGVNLLTVCAVSKVTFEQLRGDEFYEIKEALKFVKSNWKAVLLSPATLALFIIILVAIGILFGLIGKIPYFGELFIGFLWIPIFAVSLFVAYLIVIFFVSFITVPAVVATTKSDTFDSLFELFSVTNEQNWRWLIYQILLLFTMGVATGVLGLFIKYSLGLANWAIGLAMGDKLAAVINNAYCYLPSIPKLPLIPKVYGFFFPQLLAARVPQPLPWSGDIAACLIGIVLYLIFFFLCSYKLAVFSAGQSLIYIDLVKKKDEKDLLEKKEEAEEVVPEKVEAQLKSEDEKPKPRRRATRKRTTGGPTPKKKT
ncbi:hypothetical protein AMJ40_06825 [candidate division TA06 bacterium DG_26]|uniref:Glycerophosphoryl diester phosphodiesterase membrane domain-containing protein n=1 Tax=candidate division TA06 bacterium DG_26 TaxID=1703771 RepID=A0A0S7WFA3_UNCT6|nr:MAG: hypothetical protein AMJ40_06825 [candidate division TA06 bacterium DG_26]